MTIPFEDHPKGKTEGSLTLEDLPVSALNFADVEVCLRLFIASRWRPEPHNVGAFPRYDWSLLQMTISPLR